MNHDWSRVFILRYSILNFPLVMVFVNGVRRDMEVLDQLITPDVARQIDTAKLRATIKLHVDGREVEDWTWENGVLAVYTK